MTQPVYVVTVPAWLTDAVEDGRVPRNALVCLGTLSSILSVEDVSKYVLYARRLTPQTDGLYSEFMNVLDCPANVAWRNENQDCIDACAAEEEVLGSTVVQYDMEQSSYRPVGVNGDTLVLLECQQPIFTSRAEALCAVMRTLTLLIGYEQAIKTRVLEAYLNARKRCSV